MTSRVLRLVIWQTNRGYALMKVMRGPAFQRIGDFHQSLQIAQEAGRFTKRKHPNIGFKDMRAEP